MLFTFGEIKMKLHNIERIKEIFESEAKLKRNLWGYKPSDFKISEVTFTLKEIKSILTKINQRQRE